MKVKSIGLNQVEVSKKNGEFLVSYSTVVAAFITGYGCVRTSEHHSNTTSKHINKWIDGANAKEISQEELEKHFDV